MIRIGSAVSTIADSPKAGREAALKASNALGDAAPSLTFLFITSHHAGRADEVLKAVDAEIGSGALIGCTSRAVIGDGQEIEDGPGIAVWCAHLGDAYVEPFHVSLQELPDGQAIVGFPLTDGSAEAVFLLPDPYTFPIQSLLHSLNQDHPGLPIIGGMADSDGSGNLTFMNGKIYDDGAVGALVGGDISVTPIVSQGCKPVGDPFVVTEAEGNVIYGLGGKPPLVRLKDILSKSSVEDQALVGSGLQLGVVIDEQQPEHEPGDFLIRGILNANTDTGAMVIGDHIEVGQTVQFHLRDADSAGADLDGMLSVASDSATSAPRGALLFSCNGRGVRLFGLPDHDAQAIQTVLGEVPVGGMFCAGEIGPVGGQNFLHGFTASIALFADR